MYIQELLPSTILISATSPETLRAVLDNDCLCFIFRLLLYFLVAASIGYRIIPVTPSFFSEDCAKRYLSMLQAGNIPITKAEKCFVGAINLSLVFDFSKQQVTKSMGALLSFLHRFPTAGAEISLIQGTIYVERFVEIDLCDQSFQILFILFLCYRQRVMTMDPSSFRALHIFQTEAHPSMQGIGIQKEGVSLFSLLSSTSSQPGAKLLRCASFRSPSLFSVSVALKPMVSSSNL
jgi:hypothetical protein